MAAAVHHNDNRGCIEALRFRLCGRNDLPAGSQRELLTVQQLRRCGVRGSKQEDTGERTGGPAIPPSQLDPRCEIAQLLVFAHVHSLPTAISGHVASPSSQDGRMLSAQKVYCGLIRLLRLELARCSLHGRRRSFPRALAVPMTARSRLCREAARGCHKRAVRLCFAVWLGAGPLTVENMLVHHNTFRLCMQSANSLHGPCARAGKVGVGARERGSSDEGGLPRTGGAASCAPSAREMAPV
jgi:hypothetical protein